MTLYTEMRHGKTANGERRGNMLDNTCVTLNAAMK